MNIIWSSCLKCWIKTESISSLPCIIIHSSFILFVCPSNWGFSCKIFLAPVNFVSAYSSPRKVNLLTFTMQDASEYFQYLLDLMSKSERVSKQRLPFLSENGPTSSAFEFSAITRIHCHESGRVKYKRDAATNLLSLNIPMSHATNKNDVELYEVKQISIPPVSLSAFLLPSRFEIWPEFLIMDTLEFRKRCGFWIYQGTYKGFCSRVIDFLVTSHLGIPIHCKIEKS